MLRTIAPYRVLVLIIAAITLSACNNGGSDPEAQAATENIELLSVVPGAGETNVPLNTTVDIAFDTVIDQQSLNGVLTFELTEAGTSNTVGGQLILGESGQTLSFVPNTLLQPDTEYQATVHGALTGDGGEHWQSTHDWIFTTEDLADVGLTQDFWVFERWQRISPSSPTPQLDITENISDFLNATAMSENRIELMSGVYFTPLSSLSPELLQPPNGQSESSARTDVDLVAGLLEHDGKSAMALLATPQSDAERGISFDDDLSIDLTFLENTVLKEGDALLIDYTFAQAIPGQQDPDTEDGVTLFQARLADKRIQYFGLERMNGSQVLLYKEQLGVVRAGSLKGVLPAKAGDMIDGMQDGFSDCNFSTECVANFFEEFTQGAKSSFDQALENMNPPPPPPNNTFPQRRPPRRALCLTPRCGENNGDPHMTTFDGSKYDMMAVGEFTLAQNTDMEVQIRTQPWRDLDNASAAVAVAVQLGNTQVTFDQQAPRPERVRINGDIVDPVLLGRYSLTRDDAEISLVGNTLQINGLDHQISIVQYPARKFLNVYVDLPDVENVQHLPITTGLLGKASDNTSDDFTPRDSSVAIDPTDLDALYDEFIDSWRITDAMSLFHYDSGESTATFTDLNFPLQRRTIDDLTAGEKAFAENVCEAAGLVRPSAEFNNCVFDVGFTGEPDFAATARSAQLAERIRQGTFDPNDMALGGRIPLDNPVDIDWLTSTGATIRQEMGTGTTIAVRCPALPDSYSFLNRRVWGNELYRENSNLCRAGVHAGAVSYDEGGTFAVRFLSADVGKNQDDAKAALNRNGVRSEGYIANERSFDVLTADENRGSNAKFDLEDTDLPAELQELFTDALIAELIDLGASIYPGNEPPNIVGLFEARDLTIVFDDGGRDPGTGGIDSYQYRFTNQTPEGYIDYGYEGLGDTQDADTASAAFVTGNRDFFTVFARFDDTEPGCTRSGYEIISGRINGDRILGFDNTFQFYRTFEGPGCNAAPGDRTVVFNVQAVDRIAP